MSSSDTPDALTVLVADDDPTVLLAIRTILSRRGHRVMTAGDSDEALRAAQAELIDVALVDQRMPGNGMVLRARLEAFPELRGRTILMTGDAGSVPERSRPAKARLLQKPFDFDDMVSLVEALGSHGRVVPRRVAS